MKKLFDVTKIGGTTIKNRFIRSATWEGMADEEGHLTSELIDLYEKLAKGGVGLIISSYATIFKYDKPSKRMLGLYDDSFINEYKELTHKVHENNSKIIAQLVLGNEFISSESNKSYYGLDDSITDNDINELKNAFVQAALRCKEAGFDGVQIHGAHGYFLSRTLSPIYNKMNNGYGGSLDNRVKLIEEVYSHMRSALKDEFIISIKINSNDFEEGGATFEECKKLCLNLDKLGIDFIEISGNSNNELKGEGIYLDYAKEVAQSITTPVALVGVNRSLDFMEEVIELTDIQYISMCRPFICEYDIVNKFENGIKRKSRCVSCGKCVNNGKINCILNLKDN